jgi:hypothetical protein
VEHAPGVGVGFGQAPSSARIIGGQTLREPQSASGFPPVSAMNRSRIRSSTAALNTDASTPRAHRHPGRDQQLRQSPQRLDRLANCEHHADALGPQPPRDKSKRPCRRLVEPLGIVDDNKQWLPLGEIREATQHCQPNENGLGGAPASRPNVTLSAARWGLAAAPHPLLPVATTGREERRTQAPSQIARPAIGSPTSWPRGRSGRPAKPSCSAGLSAEHEDPAVTRTRLEHVTGPRLLVHPL